MKYKRKERFSKIDVTISKFNKIKNGNLFGLFSLLNLGKTLPALFLFFLIFLLLSCSVKGSKNIIINEIMYDPDLNDNYYEWIELFNPTNQSINISGWKILDDNTQDYLEGDYINGNGSTIIYPKGYAIITDHGTKIYDKYDVPFQTTRLFVDDSSIGNGLGNSGDKIELLNVTNSTKDYVEWIIDYTDIPGLPAKRVVSGNTLSRKEKYDLNNSSIDFVESAFPTPGYVNKIEPVTDLEILFYPKYIPKIYNNSEFSLPIAFNINLINSMPNDTFQLKTYVIGYNDSKYPATQTWDDQNWRYSYYFTKNIQTDSHGNWSGWEYLRFKRDYYEYKNKIEKNGTAYLKVKLKNENNSFEISKKIYLLDLDDSTINGFRGGCAVGIIENNYSFLDNMLVFIENESGTITGIYRTENNSIQEDFVSKPGYYKLTSKTGEKFKIKFFNEDFSFINSLENITINYGTYDVEIYSKKKFFDFLKDEQINFSFEINNSGDFADIFAINIINISENLIAKIDKKKLDIFPGETKLINVDVKSEKRIKSNDGHLIISANSLSDIGVSVKIKFIFEILIADLTIRKIKIFNEQGVETKSIGEGEIVRVKAFLKNIGNICSENVDASFYCYYNDKLHFIGQKQYSSVSKYQKYPSIIWDTKNIPSGIHIIFVSADNENKIEELNETNNILTFEIKVNRTLPDTNSSSILITELYYHTRQGVSNEFLKIHNPSKKGCDISGWYITNKPLKIKTKQNKIVFPKKTIIGSNQSFILTENAGLYKRESGNDPDFEYNQNTIDHIPYLKSKQVKFSNNGGIVSLKDPFNHTIDILVYGEKNYEVNGWIGSPINNTGEGIVLRRNLKHSEDYIDNNNKEDWINPRIFRFGQSDFPLQKFKISGEIKTFVSPDSSFNAIVNELKNAEEEINLNVYEFTNSYLCDEIIFALIRNISVNIFLEGSPIGGISEEEIIILDRINNYGGNIRFIVNDKKKKVFSRYRFNHAKYLVIDNQTTIVTSCNWAFSGIPKNPTYGNREWGIIIRNETIAGFFSKVFKDDFNNQRYDSYCFKDMEFDSPLNKNYVDYNYSGIYEPIFDQEVFNGNFSVTPVLSPETSYRAIIELIDSAENSILIEQLYIYKNWSDEINPFIVHLINKSKSGIDIKVILNYNPLFIDTNLKSEKTKKYLEEHGIEVKFVYSNWSIFLNVHNKAMIVDNQSVLISSINWNENSVLKNRETGLIINDQDIAKYYANVFYYDWGLNSPKEQKEMEQKPNINYKNTIYIITLFTLTFAFIARDWRNRKWT